MALLHSLRAIYLHEGEIVKEDVQLPEAGGSDVVGHNLSNLLDISSLEVLFLGGPGEAGIQAH